MIATLLLLASFAFGQDISTPTASTVNVIDQIELKNLAERVRALESGRPTITGIPYLLNGASVGAAGFTFSDDTVQTTAAASATLASSFTAIAEFATGQDTFTTAFATVTMTTGNNGALVIFSGYCENGSTNRANGASILVDGVFPTGLSTTRGITMGRVDAVNAAANLSFSYFIPALSAGSHTFALIIAASDGGTATCGDVNDNSRDGLLKFGAIEMSTGG